MSTPALWGRLQLALYVKSIHILTQLPATKVIGWIVGRFPRYPSVSTIIQRPWRLFEGDGDEKKRLKKVLESVTTVLQDEGAIQAITETFRGGTKLH